MKKLSKKKLQFYKIMAGIVCFTFSSLSAVIVFLPSDPDDRAGYIKRAMKNYDPANIQLESSSNSGMHYVKLFQSYLPFGEQIIGGTRGVIQFCYSSVKSYFKKWPFYLISAENKKNNARTIRDIYHIDG
jgi:hypothetical protein